MPDVSLTTSPCAPRESSEGASEFTAKARKGLGAVRRSYGRAERRRSGMKPKPTRGGPRPGAGRPKGTTGTKGRPKSGRTERINTKVRPEAKAAWLAYAERKGVTLGEALEERAPKAR